MSDDIFIDPGEGLFGVRFPCFPSHLPYTENKFAAQRYVKVGGNQIYSGSLNRFSRANLVKRMHEFMEPGVLELREYLDLLEVDRGLFPWTVRMTVAVHLGYGQVKQSKGKGGRTVGGGDGAVRANFDLDNLWPWGKAFLDCCVAKGVLPGDTVQQVGGMDKMYEQVPDFASRYLAFTFVPSHLYSRPWTAR